METPREQRAYWSRVGAAKEFAHPLRVDWLERHVDRTAAVLDLGCGYGRVTEELRRAGWHAAVGVDNAEGMISAGRALHPGLDLRCVPSGPTPFPEQAFAAVLLFAVLTCVPDDGALAELVGEAHRLLVPGGMLYVSDMLLQTDERNRARYEDGETRFGTHGVFSLPEGVVLRHFSKERIDALLDGFETASYEEIEVRTMNGHPARAFQLLARRV